MLKTVDDYKIYIKFLFNLTNHGFISFSESCKISELYKNDACFKSALDEIHKDLNKKVIKDIEDIIKAQF